ncbi:MAG TPA: helix-turn-helix domain-containing protein, partial [Herpetosiphonaceae bacterium]
MKPHTKLGPWIKHQRKLLDLTQEDLSRRVGYALSTVRKIESGVLRPSREVAERLAQCLELEQEAVPLFLKLARTPIDLAPEPEAGEAPPTAFRPLPSPPALFVGRESEAAFIRLRLGQPDVRVLTLVGPPGIGKTSLALHAAPTAAPGFSGGVCFVALEALTAAEQVLPAIAAALNVPEQANRTPAAAIAAAVAAQPLLLLLDNAEHVLGAAPDLAALLSACPALKLLVTSRAVLHLSGEQQVPVLPLSRPPLSPLPAYQSLDSYDSVALFVACARLALPSFALTPENSP